MSGIKIYPPNQLPAEGVTDVQFKIWQEELEVYLETEDKFEVFLPGGRYDTWMSAESFEGRIENAKTPDTAEELLKIRKNLRQFITLVAKYVHFDYYNPIIRHSTSLKWIYKKIREDYDIQQQGVHFLNILDLTWDPTGQMTPIGFYNSYRSSILGNLAKKNDVILWKSQTLTEDEKITPSHEDLILLNVLTLLHPKLPAFVKEQYGHKMGQDKRLMDFKTEILTKAKQYIQDIDNPQMSNISTEELECNYMQTRYQPPTPNHTPRTSQYIPRPNFSRTNVPRPNFSNRPSISRPTRFPVRAPFPNPMTPFCRVCQIAGLPRSIFTSHYLGDQTCNTLSDKDKHLLATRTASKIGAVATLEEDEYDVAAEYGYDDTIHHATQEQVKLHNHDVYNIDIQPTSSRNKPECNFIQPIPTQTLSVQDQNQQNIHLDLDSGATVSYAKLSTVLSHGFKIRPNSQLSKLADGKTKMTAAGEIEETFYRNNWQVRFHAIVTKDLHCDFIAGTNFMKENNIIQDFSNNNIKVHNKYTVPETNRHLILPTNPNNHLVQNNHISILLPGQQIEYTVPHQDNTILAVQPWFQNKSVHWPQPQLCQVQNGKVSISNNTLEPINIKKDVPKLQVRTTTEQSSVELNNITISPPFHSNSHSTDNNLKLIEINSQNIDPQVIKDIKNINQEFISVFNEDLTTGYNMINGKHICKLNWANTNRPPASKVHAVNYDHDTKCLLQQVCDDFTNSGVLGIPQDHNIQVQHVSPAFLVRKQRAKNKPKDQLTINDVRLVVNFGKVNDYLINIPAPITKPKDIFTQLGKWNYIITTDLYQGFYQNHMSLDDAAWLGISTPFGGLRFLRRSGQGLIGQSEELDELLTKVIGPEVQAGIAARIADDLYIGGATPEETANNYAQVLNKLYNANLKISASKTKIFLQSVDILGWVWKQGGYLEPSPHRRNSLKNTTAEEIKTVKDMRSWIGLYKTLLPASPNLTLILDPFDKLVADRDSKEPFVWDRDLEHSFKLAISSVDNLQTLYLPHPEDQLLLVVDAAKTNPGLGHTLYAIKDGKKLPVSFHSIKLKKPYSNWLPCELEALAFATAISAEYTIIKESKHPIIISPDSKAVADSVKLIRKGHFSSNPRIQTLITNVNRIPLIVQMASGKSNLNACGDFQSRHPSQCDSEHCAICSFVQEKSNSTLDPFALNSTKVENPEPNQTLFQNRTAWNKIQDEDKACSETKFFLKSGKTPSKRSGKTYSEIRKLCSIAKVNSQNLLIVPAKPNKYSSITTELTVIPSVYLPALLWQLHNNLQHPTKSQLKANFDKSFYSVGHTAELEQVYTNCHFCAAQKPIPDISRHSTETDVTVPGTHFHADVIKRQSQMILTIRDHFSSLTAAKIIKAENHKELKAALIDLVMPIRLSGTIYIKVDNATGFKPLLDDKDYDLEKLNIKITNTDYFNKNENAVVDRACYELEQELKRLEPDGRPISVTTLHKATQLLNQRLRRKGQISSYEIHFNRDMNTGTNLNLDYAKLRSSQISNRNLHNTTYNNKLPTITKPKPQQGDIVFVPSLKDKHKARDSFLVTEVKDESISMQKIIHSYSETDTNIRSKTYTTKPDRVAVLRSQMTYKGHHVPVSTPTKEKTPAKWNPIRIDEYRGIDEENCVSTKKKQPNPDNVTEQNEQVDSARSETSTDNTTPSRESTPLSPQREKPTPMSPQGPKSTPPENYNTMDNWLLHQQQAAYKQLEKHSNALQAFIPPPVPQSPNIKLTSQPQTPLPQQVNERELQKLRAKQKIHEIYKPNKPFPQLDGNYTETESYQQSSSEYTTPETSPHENTNHVKTEVNKRNKSSTTYDFCDYHSDSDPAKLSDTESLEWDSFSQPVQHHPEPDAPDPDLNRAFYCTKLNLSASSSQPIRADRVYKFNNLLDNLPKEVFKTTVKKKNSKYQQVYAKLVSKSKKL